MYLLLRIAERFGRDPREVFAYHPGVRRLLMAHEVLRSAEERREREDLHRLVLAALGGSER